jgi:NAD(P)-dependent dehydrogenase (short-subunit alcohol dehydrogenase family)
MSRSSRATAKLDGLVDTLAADGVMAPAFPADVRDHLALTQALNDAATRFGSIDAWSTRRWMPARPT